VAIAFATMRASQPPGCLTSMASGFSAFMRSDPPSRKPARRATCSRPLSAISPSMRSISAPASCAFKTSGLFDVRRCDWSAFNTACLAASRSLIATARSSRRL